MKKNILSVSLIALTAVSCGRNVKYSTLPVIKTLINETYVYAIIITMAAITLAFIISKLINWQGGKNDNSYKTRRTWYIIIGIVASFSFFLYNSIIVSAKITKAPLVAKFSTANLISTIGIITIYVIVGIITMMIFRTSKWGSILGKTKK